MKKKIIYFLAALMLGGVSVVFSACSQKAEKTETADTRQSHSAPEMKAENTSKIMELMHENMQEMQEMALTGDTDLDFARLMAIHHAGTIKMAQEEVETGKDSMLVNLAREMLQTQQAAKEHLEKFAESHRPAATDTLASLKMMAPMKAMMARMDHDLQESTDHQFASLMRQHHQSGIDMAKAYLPQAKAPEIKDMARKIIKAQQQELKELNTWLQAHKE